MSETVTADDIRYFASDEPVEVHRERSGAVYLQVVENGVRSEYKADEPVGGGVIGHLVRRWARLRDKTG